MSNTTIQTTDFIDNFAGLADQRLADESVGWLKTLRQASLSRFQEAGIPTVKDEEWKYTNITALTKQKFQLNTAGELKERAEFADYCATDKIRVTFLNGRFSPELSELTDIPAGLTVLTLDKAVQSHGDQIKELISRYDTARASTFAALNTALTDNGVYIEAAANTHVEDYVHIVHVTSASNGEALSLPRTLIIGRPSCEFTVLESHICFDQEITYFTNALTDIYLAANGILHYTKTQHESLKAYHINNTRATNCKNS